MCEESSNLSGDRTRVVIKLVQSIEKACLLGEALRIWDDLVGLLLVYVLLVAVDIVVFLQE